MPVAIIGHAIVSADGKIAAADGIIPPQLQNAADWQRFQTSLDAAALVVVGRIGHLNHPNPNRRRLVVTSTVPSLEPDPAGGSAMFWNPGGLSLESALAALNITDGTIAVAGVFDLFVDHFTGFDLAESNAILIRDGLPCFSVGHPRLVLANAGLSPTTWEILDADARVSLTRWTRH